jgi:polar amino acid transport system substrate-binding protein
MSLKRLGFALMVEAVLVLTFSGSSAAQEATSVVASAVELLPASVKESGILRIGGSYQSAPMTMLVNDGQDKAGISFELATEAAKRLGLTPEFSVIPFPGQVAALTADKIDLVWETTSITPERLEAATFIPFAEISYGLLVQKGNPAGITDFKSMCGRKIGVPQGSIFPQYIEVASDKCKENGLAQVEILTYRGEDEARLAVRSGNADGLMSGHPNNVYYAQTIGENSAFEAVELSEIESTPIGIQFKKDNIQLAKAMAEAVNAMIADGSYAQIFDKYTVPTMKVDSVSVME